MSEDGYRPSPFKTIAGREPTNCTLNSPPYGSVVKAFDKAKEYISEDPKTHCCNVSGTGVVSEWKANGKVKLKTSEDQNTTFVFTNDLALEGIRS